jgi:hypothetical protein
MQKILLAGVAAVSFAIGLASPSADASIITALVSRTAVAGGLDYTYGATLSQDQQLDPTVSPVFFTLYDFGPTTLDGTTGALSTNWSFALNANQPTPATGTAPHNNPATDDVRATYSGPSTTGPSLGTGLSNLGTFTLFTTLTGPFAIVPLDQDAQLQKFAPGSPTDDTQTANLAAVAVPTPGTAISEPASIVVLGIGLLGLGLLRRKQS